MALRSLLGKLIPTSLKRMEGSGRVASKPALEAAYEAAHADYLEAVREWEVRRAAADTYNGMMSDAMAVFFQTGERVPVMGERPPTPGLLPVFPSKEQFSRAYYSMAPDKMSSSAFVRTIDPTPSPFDSYDELLRSSFERVEKEARRQRRLVWKVVLGAEAAALVVAFGGLCYVADNNRVEP